MTCNCSDIKSHARAVEEAVFSCMNNSAVYPNDELVWLNRASMFERKFVTDHGIWYGDVLYPNLNGR